MTFNFVMLTRLTRDSVEFTWDSGRSVAFQKQKNVFHSPPILGRFDEDADTELHTDSRAICLGAVLVQGQGCIERVMAKASQTLSQDEVKY